jgi:glycosyltransferase involved in cell wall biosynthesis
MKVAVIFDRFGPYHVARLNAASTYMQVVPVELFGESTEYKWDKVEALDTRVTVFKDHARGEVSTRKLMTGLAEILDREKPDAVAINGWSDRGALSGLQWCLDKNVPAVVMSESTAIDTKRTPVKEFIKSKIIKLCASGLVGGRRHVDYLNRLGMPHGQIFTGYDVIDNQYFNEKVKKIREQEPASRVHLGLPERYFLASNRFIDKKNLPLLIRAYAQYVSQSRRPYHLVLLGDGEQRQKLESLVNELAIGNKVLFAGFRQYNELPYYYAFASVFVHASTSEQWGLVVNEAMASGLPVVVSDHCGCVPELVKNGSNGLTFNPYDEQALTNILLMMSNSEQGLRTMGYKSQEIISRWQPSEFGNGLKKAVDAAFHVKPRQQGLIDRLMLRSLIGA